MSSFLVIILLSIRWISLPRLPWLARTRLGYIYIICLWGIVSSGENEAPLEKTSDRLRADFRDKLVSSGGKEAPLEKTSAGLRADFKDKLVDFTF